MKSVSQLEAKEIVHKFLTSYSYSNIDLEKAINEMFRNSKIPKSILKREELIKKRFNEFGSGIYFKQVRAQFSTQVILAVQSNNNSNSASQAQRKKERILQQKYNSYQHKLSSQFFNVFAVKDRCNSKLYLFMFNPIARDACDMLELYSITTVTRHCLERVIERMKLNSVEKALDEIVSSLQWLESSTKELLGRPKSNNKPVIFKRHIPTSNGALLLTNYSQEDSGSEPILEGHLVTWINKEQFYKGQEVTTKEFNFVQAVNYILSNPNKLDEINTYKERVKQLSAELSGDDSVIININGEVYPYERFITALENDEYLDYIVDF
ncbi:MAG: hypothetical protein ACK4ML_03180 [Alishewanella aestuarii]